MSSNSSAAASADAGREDQAAQVAVFAPARLHLGFLDLEGGLGRRFGLQPWTARILFVLLLLVLPGSQLLVYPILWILMPSEESTQVQVEHPAPART